MDDSPLLPFIILMLYSLVYPSCAYFCKIKQTYACFFNFHFFPTQKVAFCIFLVAFAFYFWNSFHINSQRSSLFCLHSYIVLLVCTVDLLSFLFEHLHRIQCFATIDNAAMNRLVYEYFTVFGGLSSG